MGQRRPEWLASVREDAIGWILSVMDPERCGLFRVSADSEIPHDLQASAKALHMLQRLDAVDRIPGDAVARQATIEYVQGLQDPETGYFDDPSLGSRLVGADDPELALRFRRGNSKWGKITLEALGASALYPVYQTTADDSGRPAPAEAVRYIREGDWSRPWSIGSHAGGIVRELFMLVEDGQEAYRPYAEEAAAFVLSQQNPDTGMWGDSSLPLFQQISGALKVIGRFQFYLGFRVPHLDRLADSCIRHHADHSFYAGDPGHCIPRNVAEMAVVCLIHSDYRRAELEATLASVADRYREQFHMPDGGYARHPSGCDAIGWNGTPVSPASATPRSDIGGTNGGIWCLGLIAEALGWAGSGLGSPQEGWRDRVDALRHGMVLQEDGRVHMVAKR